MRIDSQRYPRNAYHFNLCFVCDAWARTVQYEPVVKKLAEYLVCIRLYFIKSVLTINLQIMMEDESGFLSRENEEPKMQRIQKLLTKILFDLNEKKVTTIVGKLDYSQISREILKINYCRG